MNEAARIAAELGLKPASEIEAPRPAGGGREPRPDTMRSATGRAVPIRWTQRRRDIFNFLDPVSISLVATDGPISLTLESRGAVLRRLGHNRGIWPVRIVKGQAMRDAATTTWDKFPLAFFGTQRRLWCLKEAERDRVAAEIVDMLALRAERDGGSEPLKHGCVDIGPDADLDFLDMEMHGIAQSLRVKTWDDFGLVRWFDSLGARFEAEKALRPDIRWGERWVVRQAMHDIEMAAKEGA